MADKDKQDEAIDRDLRLRNQFFPDAKDVIFDTTGKGYGPLPIMLRKVLRHLSGPEVRALLFLYTRAGKYRLCYPTVDEIAEELGLNRKNLTKPIKRLEQLRLISTRFAGGRRYYLIHDPRVAIQHLVENGDITGDELFMINELAQELKQPKFVAPAAPSAKKR